MPMRNKHPCNKGKIPSDKVGSRGYDGEWCVEEEKSTGVERRKWYLQSYKLAGGIVADALLAQVEMLKGPRMIILFSNVFLKQKRKRDDEVSRLQVAAIAYHTHSRSPMSSSTIRGGLL